MGFFKGIKGKGKNEPQTKGDKPSLHDIEYNLGKIEKTPAAQSIRRQIKRVCKRFRTRNE